MSWTSSLYVALHYGFYRADTDLENWDSDDLDLRPDWRDIRVLVLDTRGFPAGTFVREAEALEVLAARYNGERVGSMRGGRLAEKRALLKEVGKMISWRRGNQACGEFLSQGALRVEGRCAETNFQDMFDAGLLSLTMGGATHTKGRGFHWLAQVRAERETKFGLPATDADGEIVRRAIGLAQRCFGDGMVGMAGGLMLLSLCPRRVGEAARRMFEVFTEREIVEYIKFDLNDVSDMPELDQVHRMMEEIRVILVERGLLPDPNAPQAQSEGGAGAEGGEEAVVGGPGEVEGEAQGEVKTADVWQADWEDDLPEIELNSGDFDF